MSFQASHQYEKKLGSSFLRLLQLKLLKPFNGNKTKSSSTVLSMQAEEHRDNQ